MGVENKSDIKLGKLEQLVTDGFAVCEKNDTDMIAHQKETNGSVGRATIEIARINSRDKLLGLLACIILIPSLGFLLVDFMNTKARIAKAEGCIESVQESQDELNDILITYFNLE